MFQLNRDSLKLGGFAGLREHQLLPIHGYLVPVSHLRLPKELATLFTWQMRGLIPKGKPECIPTVKLMWSQ